MLQEGISSFRGASLMYPKVSRGDSCRFQNYAVIKLLFSENGIKVVFFYFKIHVNLFTNVASVVSVVGGKYKTGFRI